MIVKLLVTLKVRENGENVLLTPGLYDTESQNFPEALKGESRFGVFEEEEEETPKKKKDKKRGR